MKRKMFCILLAAAVSLTACGESKQEITESQTTEASSEATQLVEESAEAVQTILEYRDQLELEQLTKFSSERQEELASIMVDVKEENQDIRLQVNTVYDFMKQGFSIETLALMESADWKNALFPSIIIGQRNYYLQISDQENVRVMIAADEVGSEISAVLYSGADGRFLYVEKNSDLVKCVQYSQKDGRFASEILRLTDGYYIRYDGTMDVEDYVLVGELRANVGTLSLADGLAAAWKAREAGLTEYTGEFNETGRTKIVTPNSLKDDGMLAYATHSQRRGADYLSIKTDADADSYSFYGDFAGLFTVWGRLQ